MLESTNARVFLSSILTFCSQLTSWTLGWAELITRNVWLGHDCNSGSVMF